MHDENFNFEKSGMLHPLHLYSPSPHAIASIHFKSPYRTKRLGDHMPLTHIIVYLSSQIWIISKQNP
jgi:hypothetical protein